MGPDNLKMLRCLPAYARKESTGWSAAHRSAISSPRDGIEKAFVEMLRGWLRYADVAIITGGEFGVGHDCVLGPLWEQVGRALMGMLNGELGRMDGGTLFHIIAHALENEGFDPDNF